MMRQLFYILLVTTVVSLGLDWTAIAAEEGKKKDSDKKSFAETIEDCDLHEGLFNLYQNRDDGTIYLAIRNAQLDREYIHFAYVLDGVAELSTFRGRFLDERIFTIRRWYDKMEFVAENTAFYFDPENALARSADANISEAVIASLPIVATTEDKTTHLVKASNLFLKELFSMIKPTPRGGKDDKQDRLTFGKLSDERTRFYELKNYPENTLLRVNYVYHNSEVKAWGDDDVTDARYITAKVQHSLIAVPDNDYLSRLEDPRVGYFTTRKTDLTSTKSANYRDVIHRWHLQKKQPGAAPSEPVEPITWWIENTTPIELRDTIKAAAEAWNLAFESAGFKNAIVCKVQPDDAEWDAGDIRYNVMRWTSSPDPPFGGYGPSFVNPRTGQILGADIMLEYVFLTNRVRLRRLLQSSDPVRADPQRFPFNRMAKPSRHAWCQAGSYRQDDAIAARASLLAAGASQLEVDQLVKEALYELILHEIGHTLGLSHNFAASNLHDFDQLHDRARTEKMGVTASVMDYSPANISRDRAKQGQYYTTVPGPYDHWAIRYGYSPAATDKEAEVTAAILAESTKPEHAFGNDADDMRSAGRGIDPRIMISDLSSDPIAHAADTMQRVRETMGGLVDTFPKEGEDYHELRTAVSSLMWSYRSAATILSRQIGGVQIDRSMHGQPGSTARPYEPVAAADQQRALEVLTEGVFGADAFSFLSSDLIAHAQVRRRGFTIWELENEDPKMHATVEQIYDTALDHLLHEKTLQRIIDSSLYGNEITVDDMLPRLHQAIMTGGDNIGSFRRDLQIDYIKRLAKMTGLKGENNYPVQAQSQAVFLLEKLVADLDARSSAHAAHLRRLAVNALEP